MTIYDALSQRLGREPSSTEIKAEVERIKEAALIEAAGVRQPAHQRRRR